LLAKDFNDNACFLDKRAALASFASKLAPTGDGYRHRSLISIHSIPRSFTMNASQALPQAQRQRCEVWTRVMGYHRPVSAFNPGKQSEHRERVHFTESAAVAGRQ
jgi:hypothetical protein